MIIYLCPIDVNLKQNIWTYLITECNSTHWHIVFWKYVQQYTHAGVACWIIAAYLKRGKSEHVTFSPARGYTHRTLCIPRGNLDTAESTAHAREYFNLIGRQNPTTTVFPGKTILAGIYRPIRLTYPRACALDTTVSRFHLGTEFSAL